MVIRLKALDRKVLRDLGRLWAQAVAIALVLACGVAIQILSTGAYRSLEETRAAYYDRFYFGDVFASLKRAPVALKTEIAAISGVAAVQLRVRDSVVLDIEGMREPGTGMALSVPDYHPAVVNRTFLRAGRLPEPGKADEVAINETFAKAHGFTAGSRFGAIINGRKRTLTVTGIALSPEFIYAMGPGDMVPDERRFGILFFSERTLSGLLDLEGAFNDVS
ncbi:MAG: ABC transporter permease, partial [Rhodobiaceae bacterium]|nr:ABC transporter permease [Rhodobiaceae bacterium]